MLALSTPVLPVLPSVPCEGSVRSEMEISYPELPLCHLSELCVCVCVVYPLPGKGLGAPVHTLSHCCSRGIIRTHSVDNHVTALPY